MTLFKDQWNLEMALAVLTSETVESDTWVDAAKWIMLYGPPELRNVMRQASSMATKSCFPQLEPERYTEDGEPCYNIEEIAEVLGVSREEALEMVMEQEDELGSQHIFDGSETTKPH
jgi:hypothetical protein